MKLMLNNPRIKSLVQEAHDHGELDTVEYIVHAHLQNAVANGDTSDIDYNSGHHDRATDIAKDISLTVAENVDLSMFRPIDVDLTAEGRSSISFKLELD